MNLFLLLKAKRLEEERAAEKARSEAEEKARKHAERKSKKEAREKAQGAAIKEEPAVEKKERRKRDPTPADQPKLAEEKPQEQRRSRESGSSAKRSSSRASKESHEKSRTRDPSQSSRPDMKIPRPGLASLEAKPRTASPASRPRGHRAHFDAETIQLAEHVHRSDRLDILIQGGMRSRSAGMALTSSRDLPSTWSPLPPSDFDSYRVS